MLAAAIVTAVFTAIAAFGILIGLAQLKEGRKARAAEMVQSIARSWDSAEMVRARKLLLGLTAGKTPTDAVAALNTAVHVAANTPGDARHYVFIRYLNFFEELGLLRRYGAVRVEQVEEILGTTTRNNWKLWRTVLESTSGYGCENFRRLAEELEERYRAQRARAAREARWRALTPDEYFGDRP